MQCSVYDDSLVFIQGSFILAIPVAKQSEWLLL